MRPVYGNGMKICGKRWIYGGLAYSRRPPHRNHVCGLLAGHKPEDDGEIIHQCAQCECWASDLLIKLQNRTYSE